MKQPAGEGQPGEAQPGEMEKGPRGQLACCRPQALQRRSEIRCLGVRRRLARPILPRPLEEVEQPEWYKKVRAKPGPTLTFLQGLRLRHSIRLYNR